MARDFTKNTANYMNLGVNAMLPSLAGASAVSIHAFVTVDTFTASTSACNDLVNGFFNDGLNAFAVFFDTSSGNNRVRAIGRSVSTDASQGTTGAINLSTGVQYSIGCVFDYPNDRIRIFVDGVQDVNTAVAFANNTLTSGGASNITSDNIGSVASGGVVPVSTTRQMDGRISELSIFASDIGLAGFQMLSDGYAADMIGPAPTFYFPLLGDDSPERDHYGGLSGTITGTIAQADHPRIIYPVAPRLIFPVTVTPTFRASWATRSHSIIGGGIR